MYQVIYKKNQSRKVTSNPTYTAHHMWILSSLSQPWMLTNKLSILNNWLMSVTQPMNDSPPLSSNVFRVNGIFFFLFCQTTVIFTSPPLSSLSSDWWQHHWGKKNPAVKSRKQPQVKIKRNNQPTNKSFSSWVNLTLGSLTFWLQRTVYNPLICTCGYFDDHLTFFFSLVYIFFFSYGL